MPNIKDLTSRRASFHIACANFIGVGKENFWMAETTEITR